MEEFISNKLGFLGVFVAIAYLAVFCLILADLWAGVRKAKKRGEVRTSLGYKRTIEKIQQYYNALLALTVTDGVQMFAVLYLARFHGCALPVFPIFTTLGALGICLIEIKSILEKAEQKTKKDVSDIAHLAEAIANSQKDPQAIAAEIAKYLTQETPTTKGKSTTHKRKAKK